MCGHSLTECRHTHSRLLPIVLLSTLTLLRVWLIARTGPAGMHGLGGLFLSFVDEISCSGGKMPVRIPYYSTGGLPFAYPPLAFYATAIFKNALSLSVLSAATGVAAFANAVALPLFYIGARRVRVPGLALGCACVIYGLMPAAYIEQFEIAGLAEAFGNLAIIIFALGLHAAHDQSGVRSHVLAGVGWAFCVLSSPGSAYGSAVMALIYIVALCRRDPMPRTWAHNLTMLLAMGAVGLGLSAPYWLTVVVRHGAGTFIRSFGAQHGSFVELLATSLVGFLDFSVSGGPLGFVTDVLILSGLVWAFCQRRWWLIIWFLGFLAIPREGRWLVTVPAAILGGIGLAETLLLLAAYRGKIGRLVGFAVVTTSLVFNVIGSVVLHDAEYDEELWTQAQAAMIWARANTPADATFIVLGDQYVREWVPYVAQRAVLNVWWGQEWEPDEQRVIGQLNDALQECRDWGCVCANLAAVAGIQSELWILLETAMLPDLRWSEGEDDFLSTMWSNDRFVIGGLTCSP